MLSYLVAICVCNKNTASLPKLYHSEDTDHDFFHHPGGDIALTHPCPRHPNSRQFLSDSRALFADFGG
jgi:hypothetical protein